MSGMCDFKPGDEVECVDGSPGRLSGMPLPHKRGDVLIVDRVWPPSTMIEDIGWTRDWTVKIRGFPIWAPKSGILGIHPSRFRKVQRRTSELSIESFLTIKPGQFEEPKKTGAPVRKREKA